MFVPSKRNQPARCNSRFQRNVEPMNRIEKEQRPHPLVKIVIAPPKRIQLGALLEQLFRRHGRATRIQGLVACSWIGGRDDAD